MRSRIVAWPSSADAARILGEEGRGPTGIRDGAPCRARGASASAGPSDDDGPAGVHGCVSASRAVVFGGVLRSFVSACEQVGTGACLEALRRTRSGAFDLSHAVTLDDLQRDPTDAAGRAVPLERLLLDLPSARLTDEGRNRVSHGQDVDRAHVWPEDSACLETYAAEWVRLLDSGGRLLALGTPSRSPHALHPTVVLF